MKDVFYQLTTEDIQCVAEHKIGRKLSESEMIEVADMVADGMDWYDVVSISIDELVPGQGQEEIDPPK